MEYTNHGLTHHSTQNSVGEVDLPEPHQPGCKPPEIKKEEEPLAETQEQETFFVSLYPTGEEMLQVQTDERQSENPNEI